MTIEKFNALTELQQLALGKPTKVSPQTIALYVLSSAEWATKEIDKRGEAPRHEKTFRSDRAQGFLVRFRWVLAALQPFRPLRPANE